MLSKARADRAQQIERRVHEAYRRRLRDAERRGGASLVSLGRPASRAVRQGLAE